MSDTPTDQTTPDISAIPAPRLLRLRVVTDGSHGGTKILDADTGEEVRFDGHARLEVVGSPGKGNARLVVTFAGMPVEVAANVRNAFHLVGHTTAGKPGSVPDEPLVPAAPSSPKPGQASGRPNLAAAMAFNAALNQGKPR